MIVNRIEKLTARLSLTLLASIGMLVGSNSESLGQNETIIQSTKLVPMDADFYYGSYKLREQWDRFVAGPVTRELMSLPALEDALSRFRTEWRERKGPGATARTMLDNGNVKDILAFIQELLSSDVFVFGDKKMSIWSETMAKVSDEISQMMFSSEATTDEIGPMITNKWIGAIKEMTVPTLVIGARCNNIDLALSKIDQLEIPLFGLKQIPSAAPFFANLNRIDDNRGDRLQWTLKGSQIPWDLIPTNETFDEDLKDSLSEALDEKSVTITIGMFDGNFVVAISSTPETLMALGKNKSLMEHPDMQPARDLLSRPIAGISYVSDALAKANFNATYNNFFSRNATTNVFQVQQLLAEDSEFRDFLEDLVNDFKTVDELIAKVIPEFKGATSVSFLTDEGWERHDHFRTKDVISDSSSRLVSLEHVGSDPILMVATKVQDHPEYFQLARKVVQISKARFDKAITMDWSEHALWWPLKNKWLLRTRSTLDQCGVQADALLHFTPMRKKLRVQLPDLRYIDSTVDFSVKTFNAVVHLCRELGTFV